MWSQSLKLHMCEETMSNFKGAVIINVYRGWRNHGGRDKNLSANTLRGGQNLSANILRGAKFECNTLKNHTLSTSFSKISPLARQFYTNHIQLITFHTQYHWPWIVRKPAWNEWCKHVILISVHGLQGGHIFSAPAPRGGGKISVRHNLRILPPPVHFNNDRSLRAIRYPA